MYIAIKSEIDSRVLLYPLMRALRSYGSVLVITSNKQLNRLIDDEAEGGFRNIRIIIEESGATDDVFEEYGIVSGDYDFVILDNIGVTDYDVYLLPLGERHSESFDEDVKMLLSEDDGKVKIIQFGKPPKAEPAKRKDKKEKETVSEEYNPADKFNISIEEQKKAEEQKKLVCVPFPSYQDIENVEANHRFYEINQNLVTALYTIFKDVLLVEKIQFQKEVRKKDESSGYIKSRNSTR